jgi:hypothetical protein
MGYAEIGMAAGKEGAAPRFGFYGCRRQFGVAKPVRTRQYAPTFGMKRFSIRPEIFSVLFLPV